MGKRKAKQARLDDLYEAEESDAEEEKKANNRYDVRFLPGQKSIVSCLFSRHEILRLYLRLLYSLP